MTSRLVPLLLAAIAGGCGGYSAHFPEAVTADPPAAVGTRFDTATAATVEGVVTWAGPRPELPPEPPARPGDPPRKPNPNAPHVAVDGGLGGTVVTLRGIDPAAAAPRDFPSVVVEAADDEIRVLPGGRVGFVPVGSEVEFRSTAASLLGVRARGAAFFTLMLPDRHVARRTFPRAGRVEFTSPSNVAGAVADLFVCEHPYYTRADDRGRFRFEDVPPGEYEAVAWVPCWYVAGKDLDPETGVVFRLRYSPPAEVRVPVTVSPRHRSDVRLSVSMMDFMKKP